jgi:hypothetical protein
VRDYLAATRALVLGKKRMEGVRAFYRRHPRVTFLHALTTNTAHGSMQDWCTVTEISRWLKL